MKKIIIFALLTLLSTSAFAGDYLYTNELKGMSKILLVADLELDDFPEAPVSELERYTLNILHKNLQENLPEGTTFYRQDYPENDDVDTMISIDLLIGPNEEDTYYGDVVLEVRRLVFLAEVETELPFWSVVYNRRYIIKGSIASLKEQLRDTVEPMILDFIEDYNVALSPEEDYLSELEQLLFLQAKK